MKQFICIGLVVSMILLLSACSTGGNVKKVELAPWEPSELYTDADIQRAMATVVAYFKTEFDGCTLTEISYPGDSSAELFDAWAAQYGAEEAIVLYSTFDVGPSGGDGSLEPNSTYRNWSWILVRNKGGFWQHKTHGYG